VTASGGNSRNVPGAREPGTARGAHVPPIREATIPTEAVHTPVAPARRLRGGRGRTAPRDLALRRDRAILWVGSLGPLVYTPAQTVETAAGISAIDVVRGGLPILCFTWAVVSPRFQGYRIARGPAEMALFGFTAVALFSATWTGYSPRSAALKAILLLFMYLCVAKVVASYPDFSSTVRSVLNVTHLMLVGTLLQFLALPSLTYTAATGDTVLRLNSVVISVSANVLGVALGAGLLSVLLRVGPRWAVESWARWPLAASYVWMLLATRSRTITAAIVVVFLISAVVAMCRSLGALAIGLATAGAFVAALPYALGSLSLQHAIEDFAARGQDTSGLSTLTGRTVIWQYAVEFWHQHTLFGAGYYTGHRFALPDFNVLFYRYSNIDSTWLECLVDVGLIGTSLLALFVVVGTWQLARVRADRYTKTLALSIWATVLAISVVNPTIQSPFFTAVMAGALVLGSTGHQRRSSEAAPPATDASGRC
jgi:O-antigen ligase